MKTHQVLALALVAAPTIALALTLATQSPEAEAPRAQEPQALTYIQAHDETSAVVMTEEIVVTAERPGPAV